MTTGAELGKIVEGAEKAYNGKEYEKAVDLVDKFLGALEEEEARQKATAHIEAAARKYGEAVQEMANLWPEYNTLADNY